MAVATLIGASVIAGGVAGVKGSKKKKKKQEAAVKAHTVDQLIADNPVEEREVSDSTTIVPEGEIQAAKTFLEQDEEEGNGSNALMALMNQVENKFL